jgi:hypothetical protein
VEQPEHRNGTVGRPHEAEVAAHHQDGVEDAEGRIDGVEWEQTNVAHPTLTAHLHGAGGEVDRDDVEPPSLRLEGVPPRPAADIEHAALHGLENVSLCGGPFPVLGEEHIGGERRSSATIVQLEEQLTGLARQVVE